MKYLLLFFAAMVFYAPAYGGQLPEYNIKAQCKDVSAAVGGSAVIELQCRKDEEAAKGRLASASLPADTLRTCHDIAKTMSSYVILEQCIKDELAAKKQLQ